MLRLDTSIHICLSPFPLRISTDYGPRLSIVRWFIDRHRSRLIQDRVLQ